MANRLDYFFRQRLTEAELDLGFAALEQADHDLAADLGFVGVVANAVVSPHAPVPNLTVDVSGPGSALDQQGQRIFFSALQNVNVAQDDNAVSTEVSAAGKEKIVSVFVKFDRALSDPRIDGNSLTVFFRRDESFKFAVAQGAEAAAGEAIPPALRSDAILLADVTRRFGQAQVGADAISTAPTPGCVHAPRRAALPPPRPDARSPRRSARLLQRPRDRHRRPPCRRSDRLRRWCSLDRRHHEPRRHHRGADRQDHRRPGGHRRRSEDRRRRNRGRTRRARRRQRQVAARCAARVPERAHHRRGHRARRLGHHVRRRRCLEGRDHQPGDDRQGAARQARRRPLRRCRRSAARRWRAPELARRSHQPRGRLAPRRAQQDHHGPLRPDGQRRRRRADRRAGGWQAGSRLCPLAAQRPGRHGRSHQRGQCLLGQADAQWRGR